MSEKLPTEYPIIPNSSASPPRMKATGYPEKRSTARAANIQIGRNSMIKSRSWLISHRLNTKTGTATTTKGNINKAQFRPLNLRLIEFIIFISPLSPTIGKGPAPGVPGAKPFR